MWFVIDPYKFEQPSWNGLLNGLTNYYKMDTNGNFIDIQWGNTWTINGATFTPTAKINGGYVFDWVNDFVTIPFDITNFNNDFTFSFWFNCSVLPSALHRQMLLGFLAPNNDRVRFNIQQSGNWVLFNYFTNNWAWFSDPLSTWVFYHIVGTRIGNTLSLYWDGSFQASDTATSSITVNDDDLYIWRDEWFTFFNGIFDELGIWDVGKNATDVLNLYNWGNWLPYSSFTV